MYITFLIEIQQQFLFIINNIQTSLSIAYYIVVYILHLRQS